MKFLTVPILLAALSLTASDAQGKGYKIMGTAMGYPDHTLLYLDNVTDGSFKHIDSAYIIHGKFSFTGNLKDRIVQTAIRTRDFSDRVYFWLENKLIFFTAEKGKFKDAVIKGSTTQDEQIGFNNLLAGSNNKKGQEFLFVQKHPRSIISASVLNVYSSTWGKDTTSILYKGFSPEIKNTYYGKKILEYLTLNRNIKVGDKFADFSQRDTNGKLVKLSAFKGKVVLLEFWGSWCAPCRISNPELVKIYTDHHLQGFEIVGVAAETSKEMWLEAVKNDQLTWTNVTDFNGDKNKAAIIYGVSYYPANFLIDRKGNIVAKDLWGEQLVAKLKELL